ncbi:hypothetical protein F0562_033877 [Nyssa sinensis]|uniref:AB hydrolase-1 domain-containing protein n=1 Tax=Nyssa sinensis TaxID=561372 RepID=A0A5J5AGH0_9ASTE|nr:hypothetical protein F0562_033877 [Nyssa sinensis]
MGNALGCFSNKELKQRVSKRSANPPILSRSTSRSTTGTVPSSSSKKESLDDAFIRQQALAAVVLFQQHQQQNGSMLPFDRSISVKYPSPSSTKNKKCPRSSSSRPRSLSDSLPQPHQLMIDQDLKVDNLETKHFVLVHGGGFGAWCWYKTITLLKESGFEVDAVDLTGSGIHSCDTNSISSLAQYVKPLTDFLEKLADGKKTGLNDLMQRAQIFLYANGKDHPPTAIDLDKALLKDLLFNQSPAKDIALASVSMRPIPFAPVTEKISLSKANYGSIRRFYIKTEEDLAIPVPLQEAMINSDPPEQVFQMKESGRCGAVVYKSTSDSCNLRFVPVPLALLSSHSTRSGLKKEKGLEFLIHEEIGDMGRGVSSGGGQSSLGYLFGNGEAPKPAPSNAQAAPNEGQAVNGPAPKPPTVAQPVDVSKQIPAGINSNPANNYFRADGQNSGNFITDRPSTKVHAAPGGGSSLGYLFGGGSSN